MARWLAEKRELEESESSFDGELFVTKVFRVSKKTFEWLEEHGNLSATHLHPPGDYGFYALSVEAIRDQDTGQWNGWSWLWDDLMNSGMNPTDFQL